MPKEKNFNPVQAQRKADKAKAIKKGKAEVQQQRNEKLARKNPDRIQKQIDELTAITSKGGKLTRHEEQMLEGLQREVKAVRRARETVGDPPPDPKAHARDGDHKNSSLGKRRRSFSDDSSDEEDVPEDVRNIPMPRDTPPPIPKEVLDKWYAKRRARRQAHKGRGPDDANPRAPGPRREAEAPAVETKTVYEAKPIMRNLQQEAVTAFVPATVQMKKRKGRGQGGLLEPEEADRLEREGYLGGPATAGEERAGPSQASAGGGFRARVEDASDEAA